MRMLTCTITLLDAKSKNGHVRYYTDLDNPTFNWGNFNDPVSDAVDYFTEVGRRIDLMCLGRVSSIDITVSVPLDPTMKVLANTTADVEEIARFEWGNTPVSAALQNSIPTLNHVLFGGTSQIAAAAVPEFHYLTYLLGVGVGAPDWAGNGGITDIRGDPISGDNPIVYRRFRRR